MTVETPSLFSRVIQEHLELKRRNAELDGNMPIARYMVEDPFSNHPLFKSEEQARLEETMDGVSVGEVTVLLDLAGEETAEHAALPVSADPTALQLAAGADPAYGGAPVPGSSPTPVPAPAPGMLPGGPHHPMHDDGETNGW